MLPGENTITACENDRSHSMNEFYDNGDDQLLRDMGSWLSAIELRTSSISRISQSEDD
jgi:hypothetical protein